MLRSRYDAWLSCLSCGKRYREADSISGFKCDDCYERNQKRKAEAIDRRFAQRGQEKRK
jgi:hypothetical protein